MLDALASDEKPSSTTLSGVGERGPGQERALGMDLDNGDDRLDFHLGLKATRLLSAFRKENVRNRP
jgi:hypothetical protein